MDASNAAAAGPRPTLDWVPAGTCTLPTEEQPLRVAEFDQLFADHLVSVEPLTPTTAVLRLAGPATLADTIHDLARRESSCCSFFTFDVSAPADGSVSLRVAVPEAHAAVLEALTARAAASMVGRERQSAAGAGSPVEP